MGNKTLHIVFCIRNYSNIWPNKASIICKINVNKYLDFLRIMCIKISFCQIGCEIVYNIAIKYTA